MKKILDIPTEAPTNFVSVHSNLNIVTPNTDGLTPIGQERIQKQREAIEHSLTIAEEQFDAQYKEALAQYRYAEVITTLGANNKYHPCDDYTHQCAMICSLFEEGCPFQQKEKEEKISDADQQVRSRTKRKNDNNRRSSSKSSKRKKSK